jgi:hypothetical protein
MTNQEIAKVLHNLSVDLELSGRIKEHKACALAAGLLLQLTPQDWELVTPQDVARAQQFADLVDEALGGGRG